ncbi:hypothetical protein BGZ95_001000 [Linnemannia exigua]|uniref:Uncharacterized protein n=1 Tax=Linnemannia exigua TaxID=604196 RepID=A0AAD4DM01_9FUNG|nr:hypothetical protein BGZ95_001000 [Linnemannia exigua]
MWTPTLKGPLEDSSRVLRRKKVNVHFDGCKDTALPSQDSSFEAWPLSIDCEQGSKQSTSSAINIPSPPLTPYMGSGDSDVDDLSDTENDEDDSLVFSSRFHRKLKAHPQELPIDQLDNMSIVSRPSTSALRAQSPFRIQTSSSAPTIGFTFSSNMAAWQSIEERESYALFLAVMEKDYWKSVSTIRSTYFFDGIGRGGGFLAIPHLASHGNAKTNTLCRLLEAWLTKKLVEPTISDSIPVLEDSIQSSILSIERHLKADPRVWAGISQAFIHIRCGHVFMLDSCCDDKTIVHLGADEFYQDYPLFVDVEIKMNGDASQQQQQVNMGPRTSELIIPDPFARPFNDFLRWLPTIVDVGTVFVSVAGTVLVDAVAHITGIVVCGHNFGELVQRTLDEYGAMQ